MARPKLIESEFDCARPKSSSAESVGLVYVHRCTFDEAQRARRFGEGLNARPDEMQWKAKKFFVLSCLFQNFSRCLVALVR